MSRISESTPVTTAFGIWLTEALEDVTVKGNTIKFPFSDFGLINLRVALRGVTSGFGKMVSPEIAFEAIKTYIIETGDISVSGYDTYRKENEKDWPTGATIKRSNEGKWIAANVLRTLISNIE